eukprot:9065560-Alexandrium_andersonii.AAC.1
MDDVYQLWLSSTAQHHVKSHERQAMAALMQKFAQMSLRTEVPKAKSRIQQNRKDQQIRDKALEEAGATFNSLDLSLIHI